MVFLATVCGVFDGAVYGLSKQESQHQKTYPYFVDIQSNLLNELRTTVVIPLCRLALYGKKPITKICPIVVLEGNQYVALAQQLAGIDRKILGPEVAVIGEYRADLITAIDFIVSGI